MALTIYISPAEFHLNSKKKSKKYIFFNFPANLDSGRNFRIAKI